jgi:hypothetical protein
VIFLFFFDDLKLRIGCLFFFFFSEEDPDPTTGTLLIYFWVGFFMESQKSATHTGWKFKTRGWACETVSYGPCVEDGMEWNVTSLLDRNFLDEHVKFVLRL